MSAPIKGLLEADARNQSFNYVNGLDIIKSRHAIILNLVAALEDTVDSGYDQAGHCEQALETLRKRLEGK